MSSSSESSHRPGQHHNQQEQADIEVRRSSKYDKIYGPDTKPFGESYRRSLVVQQDQDQDHDRDSGDGEERDREDSPLDSDSVEGTTMGCSTSRTEVALHESSVKGNFASEKKTTPAPASRPTNNEMHKRNGHNHNGSDQEPKKLSDFEIIYGAEKKQDEGYSSTDIYAEVHKSEKSVTERNERNGQSPREQLLQQIRQTKEGTSEAKKKTDCSAVHKIPVIIEELVNNNENENTNSDNSSKIEDDKNNKVVVDDPISFVEEEYSYEPENDESTSKLVVRSRSLANLEQNQLNDSSSSCTPKRPNAMKITTKPDGTIRYGLRHGFSESDLLDSDESPTQESDIKNNYVSSIKSAFDAAIESHQQSQQGRAEAFDGLRQYFHDNKHGLQELLTNNNVVIIEPFRHEPPKSQSQKSENNIQRSCRITGATVKSPVSDQNKVLTHSNTLPRRNVKSQQSRSGFYHPIKVNKEIIDTELPDPEKVKTAREWFEKIFKSKSSSEVPVKKNPTSFFNTITSRMKITPEVKVIQGGRQTCSDKKRQGRLLIEQAMRDDMKRYTPHRRWTDSGSLSSGVSSDFSCDQDCDFHHHDGSSNQEIPEEYSTEDEDTEYLYPYDDNETHPVSTEVLQKIRACGTSVTYYGGKVISRSHGQCRSPMTMTIMDEIRQSGGTTEGRKKFESDTEEPYLGVKFKLVKSNSCGSRLEIAGTEEDCHPKLVSPRHEDYRGKSIAEEVTEVKEEQDMKNEEEHSHTSLEDEEDKAEADRYVTNVEVTTTKSPAVMTWAQMKLSEARKQWHCTPEAVRIPTQDMEFETFEVLDDTKPRKVDSGEPGRG